jgi:hypothetical protein
MADSSTFGWVCEQLESATSLDRIEARGTVRLALKEAGLDARSVGPDQMRVVIQKVLPAELEARAVEDASAVCDSLQNGLKSFTPSDAATAEATPDAVFKRLAGG